MKTTNQLTFTTYEASLKLRPNGPAKIIFDNIDWSFIHRLVGVGEDSSDRKLASALCYNGRLCLLFLKTPSNGTFTNFRNRLGEDILCGFNFLKTPSTG